MYGPSNSPERGGVDPELAAELIELEPDRLADAQGRVPLLVHLPGHAWFDVELLQKDSRLALQTRQRARNPMPSAAVADDLLTEARALSYAQRDLAALRQVLAHIPGENGRQRLVA